MVSSVWKRTTVRIANCYNVFVQTVGVSVITLSGEYDLYNKSTLEDALNAGLDAQKLVIDFRKVRYMDSSGLSALVCMRKERAARGYPVERFAGLNTNLRMIVRISGLGEVWPQYDAVEDAVSSFKD